MKIKITNTVRELYRQHCPFSTMKCESFEELDYKIQRCIDLGRMEKLDDGYCRVFYHNKIFIVHNHEIVSISKTENEYRVSEKLKDAHYNKTYKVCV